MRTSFAQNGEDITLWRALKSVGHGFYIDLGASDPVEDSVTKLFYEHGWSGINIEPAQGPFARLQADRPRDVNLHCLVGEQPGERTLFLVGDEVGLSTTSADFARQHAAAGWAVREAAVPMTTLAEICEAYVGDAEIHFMKIDVEGDEAAAIRGGDFRQFRPWVLVVEATLPNSQTPSHEEWEGMLLEDGYVFAYFDGLNRFYVAHERKALLATFAAQPNILDKLERLGQRLHFRLSRRLQRALPRA